MAAAATTTLLPASLQKALQEIVERSNRSGAGMRAVLLSTQEGVPLGRVYADGDASSLNEDVLSSVESVWAPPSKQIPVLGMDKLQQVTAVYDHCTLLHVYQSPVVVSIICTPESNLGGIRATALPSLKEVLQPLCKTLTESLNPAAEGSENAAYYQ